MNCKVLKGVLWKWQIQLSSIKQMAITFERHNSRNQSSTEPTSISSKSQAGFTTATCSAITQDGIPEVWETITKFIELTKSNDYFNENAWNRTNIGCSRLSTNN
jgi:hypothetical protein